MDDSRIRPISELVSSFLGEGDLAKKAKESLAVDDAWRRFAGEKIAAHSRIVDIQDGMLEIEADHPGWIQLIQVREAAILALFSQRHPEFGVSAISVRLASNERFKPAATPRVEAEKIDYPTERLSTGSALPPELKERMERLEKSLRERNSRR
jgi:hypothetical protein